MYSRPPPKNKTHDDNNGFKKPTDKENTAMVEIPHEMAERSAEIRKLQKTDETQYFERYFTELFPQVYHIVSQRMLSVKYRECYQQMKNHYDGLIQTVGNSPEPLLLAIMLLNPKKVFLIHTPETEKYADILIQQAHWKMGTSVPSFHRRSVNSSNPSDVYRAVKDQWEEWKKSGWRIAVDVTGGKKSMVSGASLAVGFLEVDIMYVDNEGYDSEARRPLDGAEFINLLPNPMQVFGEIDSAKAIELFKNSNYGNAAQIFYKLHKGVQLDDVGYHAYYLLADTYDLWDNLKIDTAYTRMHELCKLLDAQIRYGKYYPLSQYRERLRYQQDILNSLVQVFQMSAGNPAQAIGMSLLQGENGLQSTLNLLFTFYHNARRREQQQKFDMAILLLYRVLELIEQRRLAEHQIDTANPAFSDAQVALMEKKLSKRLRKNLLWYAKKKGAASGEKDKPLIRRIPLMAGYIALIGLDDPVVTILDVDNMQQQVTSRNTSIFAHGFHAITAEEYHKFHHFVEQIIHRFCEVEQVDFQVVNSRYEFLQPF